MSLHPPKPVPVRDSSRGFGIGRGLQQDHIAPFNPSVLAKPLPEGRWMAISRNDTATPPSPSPPGPPRDFGDVVIGQREAMWSPEKEKILLGPFDHLFGHPGKNIRSQLIAAFNVWLDVRPDSLSIITKAVGMLHTASLLIDDVEDSSLLRRGVPVSHSIFGIPQTINSANYVYFLALQEILRLENARAVQIYTEELLHLHRGQGMDLFWRDTLTCPSEPEYLEMVSNKTGGLFRLAIKLMHAESMSPLTKTDDNAENFDRANEFLSACTTLVDTIGLLFQILDDYKNLHSQTYTAQKGFCEDLTEGKFSFPVIHSIRTDPQNQVLINILKQKTEDIEVKKYAISYMEKTESFDYTKKVLVQLRTKALEQVATLEEAVGGERGAKGAQALRAYLEEMKVA